jgi:hypothetical protein
MSELVISPPTFELISNLRKVLQPKGFDEHDISFVASALQGCMNDLEPHPSLDMEIFYYTMIGTLEQHRSNLPLVLSVMQEKYVNGVEE